MKTPINMGKNGTFVYRKNETCFHTLLLQAQSSCGCQTWQTLLDPSGQLSLSQKRLHWATYLVMLKWANNYISTLIHWLMIGVQLNHFGCALQESACSTSKNTLESVTWWDGKKSYTPKSSKIGSFQRKVQNLSFWPSGFILTKVPLHHLILSHDTSLCYCWAFYSS